jgi:prepilin-type N-terminal cleavage/methylation domain-containing protein
METTSSQAQTISGPGNSLRFGFQTTVKSRLPDANPEWPRAFTLIELLVVIAIIAILLVAVVPAVNTLSKSSGRKATASLLLGTIEQARAQALKDGRDLCGICRSTHRFNDGRQRSKDHRPLLLSFSCHLHGRCGPDKAQAPADSLESVPDRHQFAD